MSHYRSHNKLRETDFELASLETLEAVTTANLTVSRNSKFNDSVWDFYDLKDRNVTVHSKCKVVIHWNKHPVIPHSLIEEVKLLVYLFINVGGRKAITACTYTHTFLSFLETACSEFCARGVVKSSTLIENLTELDISVIRTTFEKCHLNPVDVKKVKVLLTFMTECGLSEILNEQFQINRNEIKRLDIDAPKFDQRTYQKVMTDDLLNFLTRESAYCICVFLRKVEPGFDKEFIETVLKEAGGKKMNFIEKPEFVRAFEYLRSNPGKLKDENCNELMSSKADVGLGFSWIEFNSELIKIHTASLLLILQFTGMRYGEVADLRFSDLQCVENGLFLIKGSVKKHRMVKMINNDVWVAIPIVKAAFRVSQLIAGLYGRDFVFARLVGENATGWISRNTLLQRLNSYLYDIDIDRKFSIAKNEDKKRCFFIDSRFWITLQRIRQTVASQMVRGGINLSYLSFHLKHLYLTNNNLATISEVTFGYGNIKREIFNRKIDLKQLKSHYVDALRQSAKSLEKSKAAQNLVESLKKYEDVNVDNGLNESLIDVGIAYCIGRNKIKQINGVFIDPPCLKFGGCQAITCGNAVFVKEKIEKLQAYHDSKLSLLEDPEFGYLKPQLTRVVQAVKRVIDRL